MNGDLFSQQIVICIEFLSHKEENSRLDDFNVHIVILNNRPAVLLRFCRYLVVTLSVGLLSALLFLGSSCSDQRRRRTESAGHGKIQVLSTTGVIDDLIKEIGGERLDHTSLILGEIDPHSYELVKGDDEKISLAKIVFYNGLGLEHGASLQYHLEKHPHKVAIGNEIQRRAPKSLLYIDGQIDPHIWMDISLWAKAIDPIVEALVELDQEYADFYLKNAETLKQKMQRAHEKIVRQFQAVPPDKRFLITSHDAFNYFARAYLATEEERETEGWKKRFAAPEGLAPDGQLSVTDVRKIIDHLILYQIQVVFPESNVNRDSLRKIIAACKEMGHSVALSSTPLYGDAMGPPGSNAHGYFNMIDHNCTIILDAWENKRVSTNFY